MICRAAGKVPCIPKVEAHLCEISVRPLCEKSPKEAQGFGDFTEHFSSYNRAQAIIIPFLKNSFAEILQLYAFPQGVSLQERKI
jgi:hypothetical protein